MRNPFTMTRDEVLGTLGLQARRSAATYILPAIGMFGVGILTGAGLGLLFAPRTGREMRREIGTRMSDVTNKIKQKVRKTTDEMSQTMDEARDSLYGGNDYSSSDDYSSGLGGMDSGRRTGLTNSST